MIKLLHGDCLELMKKIPDDSVDCCITDLPYGITACKWDTVIDFELMWKQLKRIVKDNGAICLFGSEPFSSHLRLSNLKMFKYDWYLDKNWATGHLNAKRQPMRKVEVCSVFNTKNYYPQGLLPYNKIKNRGVSSKTNRVAGTVNFQQWTNYPKNLLKMVRDKKNVSSNPKTSTPSRVPNQNLHI